MNWFPSSHMPPGGMPSFFQPPSTGFTPPQALEAIVKNVNDILGILRAPEDIMSVRQGTDLSRLEHERLSRHVTDALRGFQCLATEYNAPNLCSLLPVKIEPKIFSPQTHTLVSSFEGKCEEDVLSSSKYLNMSGEVPSPQEVEPMTSSDSIREGTCFDSLEHAEAAFEDYATRSGFTICKGNSKKNVYQEFACSSRGKKRDRKVADESKRRNRASIKSMCRCHIILRKRGDKWYLSTRKLSHTHDLLPMEEVLRTSKHRQIPDDVKQRAIQLYVEGETPAKIQEQLFQERRGECTWSMKDLYNTLYRFKNAHGARSSP